MFNNKYSPNLIILKCIILGLILLFASCDKPVKPEVSNEIEIINCTQFTQYGITFTVENMSGTSIGIIYSWQVEGRLYKYYVSYRDGCLTSVYPG